MNQTLAYGIFGIVLAIALIFDLGLLSKKGTIFTIKKAMIQTLFWIVLAMAFFVFIWYYEGQKIAIEYLSAYLMEWSLSIDNVFVFILIFSFFSIHEKYFARVLLIGILLAVIFRIMFITAGIVLVERFHWLLYIFGGILIYTGITMFVAKKGEHESIDDNRIYKWLKKVFPLTSDDGGGKLTVKRDGKKYFTSIFAVIVMLATTDIVFALDSIPAVFGITQTKMVIYTSNIFAVLGLRSLFFLLKGAVDKFRFLPQGIATVLVFVGVKMLGEVIKLVIPTAVSLLVIVACILTSILISLAWSKRHPENPAS